MHQASTAKLCRNKAMGGLDIINAEIWNRGAYCGLIYKLFSRQKSIWVNGCREYNVRGKPFWTMEIPAECSWVWRGMLKNRKYARLFIKYVIADGDNTSLRFDLLCARYR